MPHILACTQSIDDFPHYPEFCKAQIRFVFLSFVNYNINNGEKELQ
jgi:hypothetical protein